MLKNIKLYEIIFLLLFILSFQNSISLKLGVQFGW